MSLYRWCDHDNLISKMNRAKCILRNFSRKEITVYLCSIVLNLNEKMMHINRFIKMKFQELNILYYNVAFLQTNDRSALLFRNNIFRNYMLFHSSLKLIKIESFSTDYYDAVVTKLLNIRYKINNCYKLNIC